MSGPLFELLTRLPQDDTALILPDGRVSYGALASRSRAIASGLHEAGLRRGDRVALYLNNSPDWLSVAFAAWGLGIGVLALNPRLGPKEIGDLVSRTASRAIVLSPDLRGGACAQAVRETDPAQLASVELVVCCGSAAGREPIVPGARHVMLEDLATARETTLTGQAGDPCLFLSTSGTTSLPKIVKHVQERVARHVEDSARVIGFEPGSSMLLAIPFCGGFGFTIALTSIAAGVPIVLVDAFDPAEASRLVQDHRVTHVMGTNDMLDKMLAAVEGERPFPSLRMFGHANFTPGLTALPAEAERRGVRMRGFYGLSETLAFVAARPADAPLAERAEGGGSLVCPDAALRIANPDTGQEAATGEAGEIQIRSPNMMIEYLDDPKRTGEAFMADGYLRTGDLGIGQPDGGFTFLTRMGDILRVGGYLVSPVEIEEVVKKEPGVAACQVVELASQKGARPVAFLVPEPGASIDADAIIARCRRELAVYKGPVHLFEIPELPVTDGPNGTKVKRNVLREMASELAAQAACEGARA